MLLVVFFFLLDFLFVLPHSFSWKQCFVVWVFFLISLSFLIFIVTQTIYSKALGFLSVALPHLLCLSHQAFLHLNTCLSGFSVQIIHNDPGRIKELLLLSHVSQANLWPCSFHLLPCDCMNLHWLNITIIPGGINVVESTFRQKKKKNNTL